jgi:RimJ/RimL family protein N-acetyltransferase
MGYGWTGLKTRLVPIDIEAHLPNCVAWMNDSEVTQYLLVGDFPMTQMAERDWLERMSKDNSTDISFAIETLEGEHIGMSGIHNINYRHGYAITGTVLGRKESWGQGYGTDAAIVRARYCFDVLGLRVLYSSILEDNPRSLGMQKKVGYEVYGTCPKKYWKRGMYRDEIQTVLTRERFFEVNG